MLHHAHSLHHVGAAAGAGAGGHPGVLAALAALARATAPPSRGFGTARTVAYPGDVSDKRASSLGEFIRGQRELSEVSVRQFAELVGISNPYLSQIERGLRTPSEQVVQSIAEALQVPADTLYDQAGVPRKKDGPSKVVQAIREDPKLTGRQRQALIEIYEAFVGVGARPRRS
jgi:transcriptional regulator with XRE-family HTH domain